MLLFIQTASVVQVAYATVCWRSRVSFPCRTKCLYDLHIYVSEFGCLHVQYVCINKKKCKYINCRVQALFVDYMALCYMPEKKYSKID